MSLRWVKELAGDVNLQANVCAIYLRWDEVIQWSSWNVFATNDLVFKTGRRSINLVAVLIYFLGPSHVC